MIKREKIGFIGIGKLGLDCAEVMAERHEVRGYDIVPRTSDTVKVCDIAELVHESDWIFIAVPTPHTEGYDGSVPSSHMPPKDFGHDAVIDAINKINTHATKTKRVVLISTVLPGTTRKHFVSLLDKKHLFLYNPYLIAMGSVKWDMANPEMVIIGTEDGSLTGVAGELIDLYKTIMQNDPRYEVGTWDECEALKIFYNTFISAKIGLVNMIQDFAMRIGNINVDVVTNALARSTMRIMGPKYMTAGMGDAGACVLPTFTVKVNNRVMTMKELYESFNNSENFIVESANESCESIDYKTIVKVTETPHNGDMIKIITDVGELIITPNHLVPIVRNGKISIIRADEIISSDELLVLPKQKTNKVKINEITKTKYNGPVYNMEVSPNHIIKDDQFYVNADTGIIVHNCHPRDNIALRWLAQEYDLGYDLFDTVMHAREIQAKNLAKFLLETSVANGNLPVVIHGKAYKPDVPYCIGSYSTLVGFYLNEMGVTVKYLDPLADDSTDVVQRVEAPHVVLWAHDRQITYEYTGEQTETQPYCEIPSGSIIVDPWRKLDSTSTVRVIHYGNTRI